jgi:hypothetical protein
MYDDVSVRGTTLKTILCDIYPHQLQFIMRLSYAIKATAAAAAAAAVATPAASPSAGSTP